MRHDDSAHAAPLADRGFAPIERVVVLRPGAIGDTILTVDALGDVRAAYPSAHIELVGLREAGELLREAGIVNEATPFDDPRVLPLFMDLPQVPACWHNSALVVAWLPNASRIETAFRAAGAARVAAASPLPQDPDVHVADYLRTTLREVGINPQQRSASEMLVLPSLSGVATDRHILVHAGSGSSRKNWSTEAFAALVNALRARRAGEILLVEGPADGEAVAALKQNLPLQSAAIARPATLRALADLALQSTLFIGNDSGASHLSARLGVPTVAIFGATRPEMWAPRGARVRVVGREGAWPSPEEVLDAATQFLGSPPLPGS